MATSTAKTCKATTKAGQPCGGWAGASGYCFAHDPGLAKERARARSKGGQARHGRTLAGDSFASKLQNPVQIRTVGDALALLERAALFTLQLENSNSRNRVLVAIATGALKALEVGALEERIAALEARIG